MGTAIKHPVPDRVKPSFVIFDIRALWRSVLAQDALQLYTHVATVGVRGLTIEWWDRAYFLIVGTKIQRCPLTDV